MHLLWSAAIFFLMCDVKLKFFTPNHILVTGNIQYWMIFNGITDHPIPDDKNHPILDECGIIHTWKYIPNHPTSDDLLFPTQHSRWTSKIGCFCIECIKTSKYGCL